MTYDGRHKFKRGQQIVCWIALAIPYYFIHSYFDFDMEWKLHIVSAFTSLWMILMSVGLIELIFHVKEARRELFEINVGHSLP
jgi:hypothetical protein